jgi:hypothetical protein
MIVFLSRSNSALLSAFQTPKQTALISRHVHTLLLIHVHGTSLQFLNSEIVAIILSTCSSLGALVFPVYSKIGPEMTFNLLNEHAPPTLRRLRIDWWDSDVPFTLSTIPQATLQKLTHLELYSTCASPCDEPYWQPLRSTSLQYLSFRWWEYRIEERISLIAAAFAQRPQSLKALIIALHYDYNDDERSLDELDKWFCTNQNDPKSSVVIVAGIDTETTSRSQALGHNLWGSWAFRTHTLDSDDRYYDVCEELLPDGKLTIWEAADRALEERRLRLTSQTGEATQE